jgi:hypothetical protein
MIRRRRSIGRRNQSVPVLKPKQALECMRSGSCLIRTHGRARRKWFVIPGGAIDDATAEWIVNRPAIIGLEDGLFPGHSQTWRMQAPAQAAT